MLGLGGIAWADDMPLPALAGRVIDRADILSDSTEANLTAKLEAHENATTNQIVIVTLPDLMGRPIEDWGLMLGRGWGVGQKGKDNGIIFLIAPNDRQLRIEVGYGLEGDLPDATANDIIQSDVIPHFKRGDMDGGVEAGVNAILGVLTGTYQPEAQPLVSGDGTSWSEIVDVVVPIAFFIIFMGVALVGSLRRRWNPKRNRYDWYMVASSVGSGSGSFGRSSSGGFSGGGGSFGGGGASGRW